MKKTISAVLYIWVMGIVLYCVFAVALSLHRKASSVLSGVETPTPMTRTLPVGWQIVCGKNSQVIVYAEPTAEQKVKACKIVNDAAEKLARIVVLCQSGCK